MIRSFRCRETERIHNLLGSRRFRAIERSALTRLRRLDAAYTLNDLAASPGNRLEALKNDRKGQHSIRINDQWRICFVWKDGDAYDVEIVDCH
jgi:toxin HigB-1